MSAEIDRHLVERINRGDIKAFEVLYHRHRDWVCRLAYRFTGDRELSLDVMQETFAYLLKKFPHFQLTSQMRTFLYPAVKHISLDMIRKKRPDSASEEYLDSLPAAPNQHRQTSKNDLAAVLSILPAAQREVLLMRMVDDMPIAEIAASLNIPAGTVKSRIHNALQALRHDEKTKHYFFG